MKNPFTHCEEHTAEALAAAARIAKLENHTFITADDIFL